MVTPQVAGNSAQVHPIHIQLDGFAAHFLLISSGFRFWSELDLVEHAVIALNAALRFSGSVLSFGLMTSRTLIHAIILAHILATHENFHNLFPPWVARAANPRCVN
jgi:hypothetical protein